MATDKKLTEAIEYDLEIVNSEIERRVQQLSSLWDVKQELLQELEEANE